MMCTRIYMKTPGGYVWAENVGELRALLGIEPTFDGEALDEEPEDDWCLCPVNVEATAEAAKCAIVRDECCDLEFVPQ